MGLALCRWLAGAALAAAFGAHLRDASASRLWFGSEPDVPDEVLTRRIFHRWL
jgi:hypothetical protein